MNHKTILTVSVVALVGFGGYLAYKAYTAKKATAGVPTNQTAPSTGGSVAGTISQWEQTIAGLYSGVSSIWTGNSTSNTNSQAPSASVAASPNTVNDLTNFA